MFAKHFLQITAQSLYSGAARESYKRLSTSASYSPLRANAAATMVKDFSAQTIRLIGAGPSPRTEIALIAELHQLPSIIYLRDIAEHQITADLIESSTGKRPIIETTDSDGNYAQPPKVDLATLLGYTFGNWTDWECGDFFEQLNSENLILDLPLAHHNDPRRSISTNPHEIQWFRDAIRNEINDDILDFAVRVEEETLTGYTLLHNAITTNHGEVTVLRFRRRTVGAWASFIEQFRFNVRQIIAHENQVPRMVAFVSKV